MKNNLKTAILLAAIGGLMIAVGGFIAPEAREAIGEPGEVDVFLGTLAVLAGAAAAAVAGAIAVVENRPSGCGRTTH